MGFPKIPDPSEIAAMTTEAMKPMADDIADIKIGIAALQDLLAVLVDLQEQTIRALGKEPRVKASCNGHQVTKTSAA